MSGTQALDDVVEKYLLQARQGGGPGVSLAMEARAELEAIRKAAKAFTAQCDKPTVMTSREFVRLMQSIARES